MAKQSIAKMAKANGVRPDTAYKRIYRGVSVAEATSVGVHKVNRNRKNKTRRGRKAEIVWAHIIADPLARPVEVSNATGVSYGYVHQLMGKVGTPREVFEAEAAAVVKTSPFPPRKILIGAAIVAVVAAWVASSVWL